MPSSPAVLRRYKSSTHPPYPQGAALIMRCNYICSHVAQALPTSITLSQYDSVFDRFANRFGFCDLVPNA